MNQLKALRKITTIVADTGDIDEIRHYSPQDATTNPSLILKAAELPHYQPLIKQALDYAVRQGGRDETLLLNACEKLAVLIGVELLRHIPGRVSTEIDARFSWDRGMCVAKARKLIRMYQEEGVDKSRVLIKMAATWQGIKAAEELEREGINCNLTLLFSFAQARACAEAGVYLISPFVGRINDWYRNTNLQEFCEVESEPGVKSVRAIYEYYKSLNYPTIIMAASFRNAEQVLALAGCDRLTISPTILQSLSQRTGEVVRKLNPDMQVDYRPSPLSEAEFYWQHNLDAMAVDKLAEGIRLFAQDHEKLQNKMKNELQTFLKNKT
ncbi:transaldolase [Salmonella enterica subsp. enterica serovar Newport]|nr:transaldolase [Salmonella enterica]EEJ9459811.1 transaldolase [Salmonella enterica subsp. enterica serovar Infantis]EHC9819353.1 transaldolase [Salmonella enterica subsp. enterica serovar Newport]EJA0166431.1 transaldolase [Salmonella enterica subsp. enterica serovar Sandiego]EBA7134436.1 transaldolase [Salmonella enterica]